MIGRISSYVFLIVFILFCGIYAKDGFEKNPLTLRVEGRYQEHYLEYVVTEFEKRGFVPAREKSANVTWCIFFPPERFRKIDDWQRVNNLPAIKHLVGKDHLHRTFQAAKKRFSDAEYDFWPLGFNIEVESQFQEFRQIFVDAESQGIQPKLYIIKRPGLARGEGVHLVGSVAQIDQMLDSKSPCFPLNKTKPLAQEYVKDVLTLEGHKVTLRIYVAITSLDPLRIYVFHDGLVRICSRAYNTEMNSIDDVYTHVDSIDINEKNGQEFEARVANSTLEHEGLRVAVKYLLKRLEETEGANSSKIWEDITHVIKMSIMAAEKDMHEAFIDLAINNRKRRAAPFEMVGYDILLDKNYKPYILEINNTPSMAPHTTLENNIKKHLLSDLYTLVDVTNSKFFSMDETVDKYWTKVQSMQLENSSAIITSDKGNSFSLSQITNRNDVWTIVETELENTRRGRFQRLFPEVGQEKYLKYVINPRNELLMNWINSGVRLSSLNAADKK